MISSTSPTTSTNCAPRLTVGQRVVGLERRLAEHIERLREALDQVGQLPDVGETVCICPHCKRARSGSGSWQPVEEYIHDHTGANPFQETCTDCREKAEQQAREANPLRRTNAG